MPVAITVPEDVNEQVALCSTVAVAVIVPLDVKDADAEMICKSSENLDDEKIGFSMTYIMHDSNDL